MITIEARANKENAIKKPTGHPPLSKKAESIQNFLNELDSPKELSQLPPTEQVKEETKSCPLTQIDTFVQNDQAKIASNLPEDVYFDESEELKRIEFEKTTGKSEFIGNLLINTPEQIIGAAMDNFGELQYLVTYKSSASEVYTPTWV